jgi:CxxC motif-containing protein (DUF1111 family)
MRTSTAVALSVALAMCATMAAQTDPGPRGGPPPNGGRPIPGGPAGGGPPANVLAGMPIQGLSGAELQAFDKGRAVFAEISDVRDGLGPRFNLDGCGGCHSQPALGGSSPAINPQPMVAAKFGAINHLPPFIQQDGPVRVARFRRNADGTPDGGVHDLFVITGRSDAPAACQITQPDFTNPNNLSLRIPTPTFGLGLIEAISESALRANLASNATAKSALGIRGRFNTNGNDGTITRFGWKAQNKSLLVFSGEAYNVEIGVTNELFPQEREENADCASTSTPEDHSNVANGTPGDIDMQAFFMRVLAPPMPSPANASIENGRALFADAGCGLCHTQTLKTGNSSVAALRMHDVNLYSDLEIHRMGQNLADGVTQGVAQGDEWRTAPLWGLGDRIFLLHDGRSKDLLDVIRQHDSQGSEAHGVVANFQALTAGQKQDVLNFLRSL